MIYLHKLLPALVSPIMLILYIVIVSFVLKKKWPLILLFFMIIILSSPIIAKILISSLEKKYPPIILESLPQFNNIVILSGMVRPILMPDKKIKYEFNESVDRIIVGLKLVKLGKTKNIILTAGKMPWSLGVSEGVFLKEYLIENGVKPENIILTSQVYNTEQEAEVISNMIGTKEIFGLVTSSFHMPRAVATFTSKDLNIYPIPVDFKKGHSKLTFLSLIPSSHALNNTSVFVREMLGRLYYLIKLNV